MCLMVAIVEKKLWVSTNEKEDIMKNISFSIHLCLVFACQFNRLKFRNINYVDSSSSKGGVPPYMEFT